MFALVWWCYPIVTLCVAVPMTFFWYVENRRDAREEREAGPSPCLAYMGRDVHMGELWCWLLYGHDGDHADQSELPETAFTREWPEDDGSCLCDSDCGGAIRQTNAAGNVVIDENLDYIPGSTPPGLSEFQETGGRALRPLPQRLSKVPTQTEHNDSGIPLCPVDDCGRWKGHGGTHY